jgi:tRNA (guanine37-N1)-methyltransferase
VNPREVAAGDVSVDVFTIFPEVITSYCGVSILGRAQREQRLRLGVHDLRAGATDAHRSVDDAPFGGGAGMVMLPAPAFSVVEATRYAGRLYALAPSGRRFDHGVAASLANEGGFSLICGRYEGFDQRILDHLVDDELSVGDFVLAGGELAALVVIEAVCRLVPGVLGNDASSSEESFATGLLEYPQYTRPASFRGWTVPDVLTSGNHVEVARWRHAAALSRTIVSRPDLVARRGGVSEEELALLERYGFGPAAVEAERLGLLRAAAGGDARVEERSER